MELGRRAKIECLISPDSNDDMVSAFKNKEGSGELLPPQEDSRNRATVIDANASGVTTENSGVYHCVSQNMAGDSTINVTVNILGI